MGWTHSQGARPGKEQGSRSKWSRELQRHLKEELEKSDEGLIISNNFQYIYLYKDYRW